MKRILPILIIIFLLSSIPTYAKVQKDGRLWQDETIYSIMVDRFNDGDTKNDIDMNTKDPLSYNGGDFQGIIDKLDYIHDMGFTTIRLTSIFDNTLKGYHGYWVNDFYKTDEHFGSIETFKKLVNEAHKRKIKVLIDFVTNNVSPSHSWVNDPSKQDWFHKKQDILDLNNATELENGWVNGLPDLNQENSEVKKYLIDAAKWWIKKTNIDGYSLPEVNNVPISFWSDFSKEVKQAKHNFFLLGIPLEKTSIDIKKYQEIGIDSSLNDQYSHNLRGLFANTDQSFTPLQTNYEKDLTWFKNPYLSANYFDNENTVRFTRDIVEQRQFPGSRWKTALAYLYSTPGIPVFYYGTEIALNGGGIPDNRQQMNFRAEKELIDYITKIGKLRNELPSLTRGTMEMLYEKNGMAVYKRVYKDETTIVAINNTRKSQHVTLDNKQVEGGKELRGLLEGDMVRSNNNKYDIILDRDKAEIYVLTKKSGLNITLIGSLIVVYLFVILFLFKLKKRK
ncbi:MAG TPA: alpha-amylase family glycosyl hydrolase [Neobacillus sp.]